MSSQEAEAPPTVSVVIVSYNVRPLLLDTIAAACESEGASVEVIVVDNASSDGSADAVAASHPRISLVWNEKNLGFGAASNLGIQRASGEFVLLLNPDVIVDRACIRTLAGFLRSHPEAGAVGPRLLRPDGRLDLASRRSFPTPSVAFYRVTGLSRVFPKSRRFNRYNLGYLPADEVHEIDSGTAACLLVRRSVIEKVGAFDTAFFMYGEDLDLSFRIKKAGWKIYYVPSARAVHEKGASSRQITSAMLREFHRAMWTFHVKHYARDLPAPANWFVWLAIWGRWALLALRARLDRRAAVSP